MDHNAVGKVWVRQRGQDSPVELGGGRRPHQGDTFQNYCRFSVAFPSTISLPGMQSQVVRALAQGWAARGERRPMEGSPQPPPRSAATPAHTEAEAAPHTGRCRPPPARQARGRRASFHPGNPAARGPSHRPVAGKGEQKPREAESVRQSPTATAVLEPNVFLLQRGPQRCPPCFIFLKDF